MGDPRFLYVNNNGMVRCGWCGCEVTGGHTCELQFTNAAKEPDGKGATGSDESTRESVLREAERLVMGDRNNTYGEPHQDFARTAGVLNSLGYRGMNGQPIKAHDVAIIVTAIKLSRLMWSPLKRDSWVDIAGYAACGLEAAQRTQEAPIE